MAEFNNIELREALRVVKENNTEDNVKAMAKILVGSNLLIPAKWDKEPTRNDRNQMVFEPNTQFQFALAKTQKEENFLVVFTSNYDYKHWDEKKLFEPMVIGFNQLLPMIENLQGLNGIVVDPTDVNITLGMKFLLQFKKFTSVGVKPGSSLEQKQFRDGEQIKVKDVEGKEELKMAICNFARTNPAIQSVYLKTRIQDNGTENWFLIVDMVPQDPNIFQAFGRAIHPFDEGKQAEFLFDGYTISKKIINGAKPVYVRES